MSTLLQVDSLRKYFSTRGLFGKSEKPVKAVDGVSFEVAEQEMFGLAGESGCGKTTVAKVIARLLEPSGGRVLLRGNDINRLGKHESKTFRRSVQMVFQDPLASLNPRMKVREIMSLPYLSPIQENRYSKSDIQAKTEELLTIVDLSPKEYLTRYPHELSGGERQRIALARAIATEPLLVLADEPVASLDVSIRGKVLSLMKRLQQAFGMSFLLITHDLSVLRSMCNKIAIMYVGKIVELAPTVELFDNPRHPYTLALLSAQLIPDPSKSLTAERIILKGEVPSPANPPAGCRFHPRCEYASEKCSVDEPAFVEITNGHYVACHNWNLLSHGEA
jgi:oligopeptide/dipeptide ABC transporter ATP-binding protein